jgi:hypothetical protein
MVWGKDTMLLPQALPSMMEVIISAFSVCFASFVILDVSIFSLLLYSFSKKISFSKQ